jgi:hypothetical protein
MYRSLCVTLTPSSETQRPHTVIQAYQTGRDNSQLSNNALLITVI